MAIFIQILDWKANTSMVYLSLMELQAHDSISSHLLQLYQEKVSTSQ